MRIATWNCQGGLNEKQDIVGSFASHVAVIQETAEVTELSTRTDVSHLWKTPGKSNSKGIGVFGFGGWTISPIDPPTEMPWVLPAQVTSPDETESFLLLAIWTNKSDGDRRPLYATQVDRTITAWESCLDQPVVIAGDFNGSAQGPEVDAHKSNVAALTARGIHSAYHAANGVEHGMETSMTLKWMGRGRSEHRYHCDFIFASSHFDVVSCEVMPIWERSPKQPSDHQPVVATLSLTSDHPGRD